VLFVLEVINRTEKLNILTTNKIIYEIPGVCEEAVTAKSVKYFFLQKHKLAGFLCFSNEI